MKITFPNKFPIFLLSFFFWIIFFSFFFFALACSEGEEINKKKKNSKGNVKKRRFVCCGFEYQQPTHIRKLMDVCCASSSHFFSFPSRREEIHNKDGGRGEYI
jgi:hypothetical protein